MVKSTEILRLMRGEEEGTPEKFGGRPPLWKN